ncbi:MAG: CDP-alcohol phosphatidyltransferase family protein [bacterium]
MDVQPKLHPQDKIMAKLVLPLIPEKWEPNYFTIARFILTPFVVLLIHYEMLYLSIFIFLITAFTDTIDGSLARVRNKITDWGKLYDPVADKLLIGSIVYMLVAKYIDFKAALIIIILEIMLIGGGIIRLKKNLVVQANLWSKIKMNLQVLGSLFLLVALPMQRHFLFSISAAAFYLAIAFAIVALFTQGI